MRTKAALRLYPRIAVAAIKRRRMSLAGDATYLTALDAFFLGTRATSVRGEDYDYWLERDPSLTDPVWRDDLHLTARAYRAYASWLAANLPDPGGEHVALVGDSWSVEIEGVLAEALTQRFGRPIEVRAYSLPGATLDRIVPLVEQACAERPAVCVVEFGANDLAHRWPIRWVVADAAHAAGLCTQAGVPCVIPGTPPVAGLSRARRVDAALHHQLARSSAMPSR